MDESQADGERGPERSFPLSFDPVAGMRAVADIQAEGLRAAGDLLERILRAEPDGPGPRQGSPAGDYTALVDAWTELLRRTVAAVAQAGRPGAVTVPVDASGVGPPVRLTVPGPDSAGDATAEVWLHNGTRSAAGPLALRCGQLSACDGAVLDDAEVRFEPAEVTLLPPRSSRAVVVSLATGTSLRPGAYRGTIQADGAPGLWLPFEVTIDPC